MRFAEDLTPQGNTVVVIEHNLENLHRTRTGVIKTADWIIDLGLDSGDKGGEIVATGTPEAVVRVEGELYSAVSRAAIGERWWRSKSPA